MITAMDTPQAGERMAETVRLTEHPILITLRDVISGDGFLSGITLSGRALMRQESRTDGMSDAAGSYGREEKL
jgi:hypothetical protein